MTIYYNPAYSAAPYRNGVTAVEFGDAYCGDVQLLQKLLFYAPVALSAIHSSAISRWV